jgi:hypothetical protein
MSRHPEPAIVTHYRATLRAEPPPEFASEPGGCALWVEEIPF